MQHNSPQFNVIKYLLKISSYIFLNGSVCFTMFQQ